MGIFRTITKLLGLQKPVKRLELRKFTPEEFSAFCLSGKANHIDPVRMHEDFRAYLQHMNVPSYVANTVRAGRNRKK